MTVKCLKDSSDTFNIHFPGNKPFDVVGFGLNSVDHLCVVPRYPQIDSKTDLIHYATLPGGQVATALTFLSRLGLKTKYVGKIGGDEFGRLSLESIRSELIDVSSVLVDPKAANQCAFIIIDQQSGARTILCHRDCRLDFKVSELKKEDVDAGKLLHLDGYDSAAALLAATHCQAQGIPVSLDLDRVVPRCAELIQKVDFLIVSSTFPGAFTGISDLQESLQALQSRCRGFLAVTLGHEGAMALVENQCFRFAGFQVKAVDTTGAGDIFHAGFIYGLLQNWPLKKIMAFANAASALNCMSLGARSGIRPLSEILRLADQAPYSR
jgi:sulfofructose kinase